MEKITSQRFNTILGDITIGVYDTLNKIEFTLKYVHSKIPNDLKIRYTSNVDLRTIEDRGNIRQPNYIETRLRKVGNGKIYWVLKQEVNDGKVSYYLYVDQLINDKVDVKKTFYKKNEELNEILNRCLSEVLEELDRGDNTNDTFSINENVIEDLPNELKEAFQNDTKKISEFLKSVSVAKQLSNFKSVCDIIHYISETPSSWLALKKLGIQYNSDLEVVPNVILEYICAQA